MLAHNPINPEFITCSKCGEVKPRRKNGKKKSCICRECKNAYKRKRAALPEMRDKERERAAKWRANNPTKARAGARRRFHRQFADPAFRIAHNVRRAVHKAIAAQGGKKAHRRTAELIGYDPRTLAKWAARNGYNPPDNEIDHCVPVAWWLRRYPNDIVRALRGAWNLANLRVISAQENRRKNARREFLV